MRETVFITLNGIDLESLDPCLHLVSVTESSPKRDVTALQRSVWPGSLITNRQWGVRTLKVSMHMDAAGQDRRNLAFSRLLNWLNVQDGRLTASFRPERVLTAVEATTLPDMPVASFSALSFTLMAYDPLWYDLLPRCSVSGNGGAVLTLRPLNTFGTARLWVKFTASAAVSVVNIVCGDQAMRFSGLSMAAGDVLTMGYDKRGLLTAAVGASSVLGCLNQTSRDGILLVCGTDNSVKVTGSAAGTVVAWTDGGDL